MGNIGVSTSKSRMAFQELPEIQQFRRKSVRKAPNNNRLYDGEIYYNPNATTSQTTSPNNSQPSAKFLSANSANSPTSPTPSGGSSSSSGNSKRHGSISGDVTEKIGYEVIKLVGRGTFGEVYHVKQTNTGKDLALKILIKPEKLRDLEKIQNEIEIMKSLIHPNILRLLDTFEMKDEKNTDCIVIVSEYCELGSIADYLEAVVMNEKVNFPVWSITGWFVDMIESIKFCSARGVIHRDIKPSNMLIEAVDGRMVIKLADFGLSKALMAKQMASTMCGSPLYAAPEIYNRTGYTSAVDVYSLGVTILELACSYSHDEFSEIVVEEPHRVMELFNSVKLPSMKELIMKMIHPDPKVRIGVNDLAEHPLVKSYRFLLQLRAIKGVNNSSSLYEFLEILLGDSSNTRISEPVGEATSPMTPLVVTNEHRQNILSSNELNTKEFFSVMMETVTIHNSHPKMAILHEAIVGLTVLKHQLGSANQVLVNLLTSDDANLKSLYALKFGLSNNTEVVELVTEIYTRFSKLGDAQRTQVLKVLGDARMEDKVGDKGEDIKQFMKELFKRDVGLKTCAQVLNSRRKTQLESKIPENINNVSVEEATQV
ncbi:predicted protein [Naegleria gruberi]|uniref:Predicted protein n=1 Tax=Naegleria gruberi TaxID=5762 RepID=D2VZ33_NAEGR|nr:uncharacterized protein NAEGRDRAFT_59644 [Naegleria gruberi]EFC37920.1 predicted protein [Naegleria gruberi]|eukprot:XP_002670664.1 predicted protein [Naegleria gruberi strain NEG-M]